MRDLERRTKEVTATLRIIAEADADLLLLQNVDWDAEAQILKALAQATGYRYMLSTRPNSGVATGLDLDGDGRLAEAEDAMGYGRFAGQGGMAVLSRVPLTQEADLSATLWKDLPGSLSQDPPDIAAIQRLASVAHWVVTLETPSLRIFTLHAQTPVFDGPEDRNGRRNHDEIARFIPLIDASDRPVILAGNLNLDPIDGEGRQEVLHHLLEHPRLQDPAPRSTGAVAAADPDHRGDPATDTADWPDGKPGNLRVSYILPDTALTVVDSGVLWSQPHHAAAGPHRLVWVDIAIP